MKAWLISTAASLICAGSAASRADPVQLDLAAAIGRYPVAAWVEIEAGTLVAPSVEPPCGARYVARVIRGIKGVDDGARIEFGPFRERRVGIQYFVLLQARDDLPSARLDRCRAHLPTYLEVAEGYGTLEVDPVDRMVSLTNPTIAIPESLTTGRAYRGQIMAGELFGTVRIEADEFHRYLRRLATPVR